MVLWCFGLLFVDFAGANQPQKNATLCNRHLGHVSLINAQSTNQLNRNTTHLTTFINRFCDSPIVFFFLALCSQDTKLHVSSKHFGSFSLRFVSKHLFVQLWGVIGAFAWWYHTTVSWKDDSKSLTLGA